MKKNKFLRIASALLMLCLITTCAVSGTFAKYTTSDSDTDTARVAKWGVTVAVDGTLFGKYYGSNTALSDADQNRIVASSTNVASDADGDGKNVVAPGTKNDTGFQVKLSGKPEVAFTIAAEVNAAGLPDIEDICLNAGTYGVMVEVYRHNAQTDISGLYVKDNAGKYTLNEDPYNSSQRYYELQNEITVSSNYYPVVWTLKTGTAATITSSPTTTTHTTLSSATTAMLGFINGFTSAGGASGNGAPATSIIYDANVTLDQVCVLTWEWAITNTVAGANDEKVNAMDTILGNLMAGDTTNQQVVILADDDSYSAPVDGTNYNLDVAFNFSVTATQVD